MHTLQSIILLFGIPILEKYFHNFFFKHAFSRIFTTVFVTIKNKGKKR